MSVLEVKQENSVHYVTINRPQQRNALNRELRLALIEAMTNIGEARLIVLRGSGGAFCAGQDLGEAVSMMQSGGIDAKKMLTEEYEPILHAIDQSPVNVISAVEGSAAGAGMALALACDICVAPKSAVFHLAFSKMALVHDVGASYILPRLIGRARAMGMALLSEPIDAGRAEAWGMIWRCYDDADFNAELDKLIQQLVAGSRDSAFGIRRLTRLSQESGLGDMLEREAILQDAAMRGDDFSEAVTAFMDKRKPEFK